MAPQVNEGVIIVDSGRQEVGIIVYDGTEGDVEVGEGNNASTISSNPPSPAKSPSPEKAKANTNNNKNSKNDDDDHDAEIITAPSRGEKSEAAASSSNGNPLRKSGHVKSLSLLSCGSIIEEDDDDSLRGLVFEDTPIGTPMSTTQQHQSQTISSPTAPIVKNPTPEFRTFSTDSQAKMAKANPPRKPTAAEPERPKPVIMDVMPGASHTNNKINNNREVSSSAISTPSPSGHSRHTAANAMEDQQQQQQLQPKQALIDSIFGSLSSYLCRNDDNNNTNTKDTPQSPQAAAEPTTPNNNRSKNHRIPGSPQRTRNSTTNPIIQVGSDDSSPIKLHALATPGGENNNNKDALDYVFDRVEGAVCRESSSTPQTPSSNSNSNRNNASLHMYRENSLLDLATAESDEEAKEKAERNKLSRIRQKKRDIEAQVRSNSSEPGILIPRGYLHKDIPSKTMSSSVSGGVDYSSRSSDRHNLTRHHYRTKRIIAGTVVGLVFAAIALVALSFFWPAEKL